jgi:hypothetical protein
MLPTYAQPKTQRTLIHIGCCICSDATFRRLSIAISTNMQLDEAQHSLRTRIFGCRGNLLDATEASTSSLSRSASRPVRALGQIASLLSQPSVENRIRRCVSSTIAFVQRNGLQPRGIKYRDCAFKQRAQSSKAQSPKVDHQGSIISRQSPLEHIILHILPRALHSTVVS